MKSQKNNNTNQVDNPSDVKALKDQNKKTKDSDHKNENAANAKSNSGHYQAPKK